MVLLNDLRRLKIALLIAAFTVITSLPQLYVCYIRGSEWNGSCAYLDTDELAYSAYINALIDGRPRRNDPYTGNDNGQSETLFSIQFLPAYLVALPAKVFHVSASAAFIVLVPIATVVTALLILWLLSEITGNIQLSSVGAIGVLCLGTVASYNPLQALMTGQAGYDMYPFLRRYIPAVPFPFLIAGCIFMWRALTRNVTWAILSGVSFTILVYSYFFLWTAAATWFFTVIILWFILRPEDRRRTWQVSGTLAAIGTLTLLPYVVLLSHRVNSVDRAQLLEFTHAPDLLRAPELYGALILCGLAYYGRRRLQGWRDPKVLFAASFALAPFLIFNQQILTGRSLQSFHYEEFATNYLVLLAAFIGLGALRPNFPRRILVYLGVGTMMIALLLALIAIRSTLSLNVGIDKVRAVALTFRRENRQGTVFASDSLLTHSLPSVSNNSVLWARHLYTFSDIGFAGQKARFFEYIYYSGFDEKRLAAALHNDFGTRWEVFGAERANPVLTAIHNPISDDEINSAAKDYAQFVYSFDITQATRPLLSYAVVSPTDNLMNLDKWYERGPAERTGDFIVYPLRLRNPK